MTAPNAILPEDIGARLNNVRVAIENGLLDQANTAILAVKRETRRMDAETRLWVERETHALRGRISRAKSAQKSLHVLIIGDSLSLPRPFMNKSFHPIHDPRLATPFEKCYGSLLGRELRARKGKYGDVFVTNLSMASMGMADIKRLSVSAFHYHNPDCVVLHVGIVDCAMRRDGEGQTYQNMPADKFEPHYQAVLDYKKETCLPKRMVVLPVMKANGSAEKEFPGQNASIDEYNRILAAGLDRYSKMLFIEGLAGNDPDPKLQHLDGYHLSTAGHYEIFTHLSREIYSLFPKLDAPSR